MHLNLQWFCDVITNIGSNQKNLNKFFIAGTRQLLPPILVWLDNYDKLRKSYRKDAGMKLKTLFTLSLFTTLSLILISKSVQADSPPIIINNNTAAPSGAPQSSAPTSGCNNSGSNSSDNMRPGTYYQTNPNGGTNTIYTTGDKTPYDADINCNNTPVTVQPYVYAPTPPLPSPPTPVR